MRKLKLLIAYKGTNYHGWQIQNNAKTISGVLSDVFFKIFGERVIVFGASRTDTGVHALGQVAQCYTSVDLKLDRLQEIWNRKLPQDIVIRSIIEIDTLFHPCANVRQKTYYYHLFLKRPLPFFADYGWYYDYINRLDLIKFNKCLALYQGTHDFASFCKVESDKATVRTIDSIKTVTLHRYGLLRVEIKGKSFLRFQIRRMVGYALDIACKADLSVDYLKQILDEKNPRQLLRKADGKGLCLRKIIYEHIN